MDIIRIEQGTDEWQALRAGKITGTKIGKLYSKTRKADTPFDYTKPGITLYEIFAERYAEPDEDGLGSNRDRGHRLESEAIDRAEERLGVKFERGNVWRFDENHIGSPDGYTADSKTAIEVKCLATSRHIQAIATDTPPEEYRSEYINYFFNPNLERLIVALYDPRMPTDATQLALFEIKREDIESEIEAHAELRQTAEGQIKWLAYKLLGEES